jgi:hypothetical protein
VISLYEFIILGKATLLLAAVAGLFLDFVQTRRGGSGFDFDRFLVVLALLSAWAYTNFGEFHSDGYVHLGEMYPYYLSSKYAAELGYDGLYGATLAADREDPNPCFRDLERVRDLRTAEVVPAEQLRRDPSFRRRFSAERWDGFREDLAFLKSGCDRELWSKILLDHGYNAPPSRTIVTAAIASALGRANRYAIHAIALFSDLLLVVTLLVVYRSYGLRSACLGAVLLGASTLSTFHWIGGSFLREDWLVLSVLGVCAMKTRRYVLAGSLLGVAALFRLFPAFFAFGFVLQGGLLFLKTHAWHEKYTRFLLGLLLSAVLLIVPSLVFLGGFDTWLAFHAKIALHLEPIYANHVGLRALIGDGSVLLPVAQAVFAGLYLFSLPRVNDEQAVILGGVLVYAFGYLAGYYYSFLILFLLWTERQDTDFQTLLLGVLTFAVLGVAAAFLLLSEQPMPYYDLRVYVAASAALLLPSAALLWQAGGRAAPGRATPLEQSG